MTHSLEIMPYRGAHQQNISEKKTAKKVEFCQKLRNWTAKDVSRVIWSDESMLELEHSFNSQNDRVWAKGNASVPPRLVSKHLAKIMEWGP